MKILKVKAKTPKLTFHESYLSYKFKTTQVLLWRFITFFNFVIVYLLRAIFDKDE